MRRDDDDVPFSTPLSRRLFVLFVFVTIVFTSLAWVLQGAITDIKNAEIHDKEQRAELSYAGCLAAVGIITRFNDAQLALAALDDRTILEGKASNPAFLAERAEIYRSQLIDVPDCVKP